MKVTIFGATGGVGHWLLERCVARGDEIRVLVRDPAKLSLKAVNVHTIVGDVTDAQAVAQAVEGADVVYSAIGPGDLKPTTLYSQFAVHVIAAMKHGGVRRLIVVTSGGVEKEPHANFITKTLVFGTLLKNVLADMRVMEARIAQSAVDWTVVRPTRLTDDPGTGTYRTNERTLPKGSAKIARADVADFMVKVAADPKTFGKAYAIAD